MDINAFANRLRQLRGDNSRNSVALDIGINPQTLERYEKGQRKPDIEMITDIAKYYNVSVDWLLGVEEKNIQENEFIYKVSEYLGLSKQSIKCLHEICINEIPIDIKRHILSNIISNDFLYPLILNLWDINENSTISVDKLSVLELQQICNTLKINIVDTNLPIILNPTKNDKLKSENEYLKNENVDTIRYRNFKLIEKLSSLYDHRGEYKNYSKEQLLDLVNLTNEEYEILTKSRSKTSSNNI